MEVNTTLGAGMKLNKGYFLNLIRVQLAFIEDAGLLGKSPAQGYRFTSTDKLTILRLRSGSTLPLSASNCARNGASGP